MLERQEAMMRVERPLLRYSDGQSEWHTPGDVPDVGTIVTRGGRNWIVSAIEDDGDDTTVAVLRRAPKAPNEPEPSGAEAAEPVLT